MEKDFKVKCFKSLVNSLTNNTVEIYIIGDKLSEETILKYKNVFPHLVMINSKEKLGNQGSLFRVFELADSFSNDNDIIYFSEDDYLCRPDLYRNTITFFNAVKTMFDNVFFHPSDYPDQYSISRMRRNYIFKNDLGGWYREVDSTTFTFACRLKTYKKYNGLLKDCALKRKIGFDRELQPVFDSVGADDGRFSEIFGYKSPYGCTTFHQTALCFCPLPGLASHMHIGTESLHFNWENLYDNISNYYP